MGKQQEAIGEVFWEYMHEPTESLKGSDFEGLVQKRCESYYESKDAHITKYGVQVYGQSDPTSPGGIRWQPIRSYPDFEGALKCGRQVIFDAKVCSQATFSLSAYRWEGTSSKPKAKQLRHMLDRSEFAVPCSFIIHWNKRELSTKSVPAQTWLFPIDAAMPFWRRFCDGEQPSISLEDCREYGVRIAWTRMKSHRYHRPEVLAAILEDMENRQI